MIPKGIVLSPDFSGSNLSRHEREALETSRTKEPVKVLQTPIPEIPSSNLGSPLSQKHPTLLPLQAAGRCCHWSLEKLSNVTRDIVLPVPT